MPCAEIRTAILYRGAEGDAAFLVVSGSVEVSVGEGAKAKTVATLNAGEVFGEMCLIEPGPRSATVKAVTDTECIATSYDDADIFEHGTDKSYREAFGYETTKRARALGDSKEI